MGWCDDSGVHEGFIVGIVPAGICAWRELSSISEDQRDIADLKMLQVGCDCGWRSARIAAPLHTDYMPCIVLAPPEFEELAHRIWLDHIRGTQLVVMPWSTSSACSMPFDLLQQIRKEISEHDRRSR